MRQQTTLLAFALALPFLGCSSGLGNNIDCSSSTVGSRSGNLTTGLFFGFTLRQPVTDHAAAGGLIPGSTSLRDRNVIFYAFESASPADDAGAPGAGARLDRDGHADPNGQADVFVAAVVGEAIDTRAFSYSLAGKFRHARCTSCHSLAEADTTVFPIDGDHPGLPAGDPGLQDVQESPTNLCMKCHRFALDALPDQGSPLNFAWRNPPVSLGADFRKLTTGQMAERARTANDNHFERDRRVTWALSSGIFTQISPGYADNPFDPNATGFVTGGADNDWDGATEAFDSDGRRRLIPGGRTAFLTEAEAFRCGGPTDTRAAIADVALVSRRSDVAQSGSGTSTQPDLTYVPNDAYVPGGTGSAGTLYVAFTSDANDLVTGVVGSLSQVYRARFDVRIRSDGRLDLVYGTTELVSNAGAAGGNQDSDSPSISLLGDRIAFASRATDIDLLGPPIQQIYVRDLANDTIELVSTGGTLDSSSPVIDPSGTVVAFVSRFHFDGGSPLGLDDVYYAELRDPITSGVMFVRRASRPNPAGGSDNTGASRQPEVIRNADGEILVAFASTNDLDTATLGDPVPAENVYLHRDNLGIRSTALVSIAQNALGATELPDGSSNAPAFVGGPDRLLIETSATNLDSAFLLPPDPTFGASAFASGDENGATDVVMLTGFLSGAGTVRGEAISVSPAGAFGDRASVAPLAGSFALPAASAPSRYLGFAGLRTLARNIGAADNHAGLAPADATPWLSFIDDQVIPQGPFAAIWSFLGPKCLSCHNEGFADNSFSLGNGNPHTAYERLISGTTNDGLCANEPYVVPGNRALSVLQQLLTNTSVCGIQVMPPPTSPALSSAEIDAVGAWIDAGAPE
ncbi:MAG: hypothetical protein ACI8QZ_000969 [Chlamydiales bacterium]|jgi:hypothetical protein